MNEFLKRTFYDAIVIMVFKHSSTRGENFGFPPSCSRIEPYNTMSFSHSVLLLFFFLEATCT